MDPATLATGVTMFLVPLLSKLGEGIAGEAQKKLPDEVNKVWGAIVSKFSGKPAAQGSAEDFKAKASDADNQEAFTVQLKKTLKDNPEFAAELEKLFQAAQAVTKISSTGGAVATQGGIAVGGSVGGSIISGNNNVVVSRDIEDSNAGTEKTKN